MLTNNANEYFTTGKYLSQETVKNYRLMLLNSTITCSKSQKKEKIKKMYKLPSKLTKKAQERHWLTSIWKRLYKSYLISCQTTLDLALVKFQIWDII